MQKSICILSYSDIAQDGRVLRQVQYLSHEYELTIIGHGIPHPSYPPGECMHWVEVPRGKRSFHRMIADLLRILRYATGLVDRPEVLKSAISSKCDAYHANNWDALPVAAEAARQNHARLVLDIHESLDVSNGWLYYTLNKAVVKRYAKQIDACTTVVSAIANRYRQIFGLDPIVLMNAPALPPVKILSKKTDPNKIRLIHHGVASPTRRTDLMIKTIAQCDVRYELHLVFTNLASAYVTRLRRLADQIAPGRVIFHPAFSPREIVQEIANYDVGFFPLPPTNYNYIITLPNKFFEFIAAGLAVCIGPSLSMAEIVKNYGCGVVAASFEPAVLAGVLNQTTAVEWDEMRQASLRAAQLLNADVEMGKLSQIYHELLT